MTASRTGQPAMTSAYDAFGRRVRRTVGSAVETFLRGEDGALLAETDAAGTVTAEHLHLDGRLVAIRRADQL